jgi:hypothetical protein
LGAKLAYPDSCPPRTTDEGKVIAVSHQNGEAAAATSHGADEVAARVAAIFEAAELAAAEIRREADELYERRRAEADRLVEDARAQAEAIVGDQVALARQLARTLVERATELLRRLEDAENVKDNVDRLLGELDDVTAQMTDLPGGTRENEPSASVNGASAPAAEPVAPATEEVDEPRAMALQMALGGRTRAEVEADLVHGLHVKDPDAILDDIFGMGTPGSQRIPWSRLAEGESP